MEQLLIHTGANGSNTYAIGGCDTINVYYGDAAAATFTAPTGAKFVLFSATDNFYVRWEGSNAAIPSADVTNGTGSECSPVIRKVVDGETFSIIAAADVIVTMSWYS